MVKVTKTKIRKGDKIRVIAGKDIGKEGTVEKVFKREGRVTVAGVNLLKKHVRQRREREPAGIVTITSPIHISNVMLICPKCSKPTRVGYKVKRRGKEARVCRRCQEEIG